MGKSEQQEIIIPLPNGGTLRCGPGEDNLWGGYVRICDADGIEVVYWEKTEWKEDSELVMGAIFGCASAESMDDLLTSLNRQQIVDDHWE